MFHLYHDDKAHIAIQYIDSSLTLLYIMLPSCIAEGGGGWHNELFIEAFLCLDSRIIIHAKMKCIHAYWGGRLKRLKFGYCDMLRMYCNIFAFQWKELESKNE